MHYGLPQGWHREPPYRAGRLAVNDNICLLSNDLLFRTFFVGFVKEKVRGNGRDNIPFAGLRIHDVVAGYLAWTLLGLAVMIPQNHRIIGV